MSRRWFFAISHTRIHTAQYGFPLHAFDDCYCRRFALGYDISDDDDERIIYRSFVAKIQNMIMIWIISFSSLRFFCCFAFFVSFMC